FKDITAQQLAAQERERLLQRESEARREAEEANRLKDEFLATVSHELRTPLTSMLGWLHLLRTGTLPAVQRGQALETIERNARSQAQLVEDLLDMSRILSGRLRLELEPIEVAAVVEAALDTVRPTAEARGVRLQSVLDAGGLVMGDPNRLQQIVWNLLANAVKFTPKGGRVHTTVQCLESSVEIVVSDTGQGITPGFLPHVFERFRQADGGIARVQGGLGLGLSIVRQLVETLGGTVSVASPGEGQGATFTVRLPVAVARRESVAPPGPLPWREPAATVPRGELAGLLLLVVDDDGDARDMLAILLEASGARVRLASSAAEGRELFAAERPDVVVSDIGMAGENGHALIESLRRLPPGQGGDVPAVALTAYARSEDRTRALKAGFSSHVAKPVEP
ncbi:MAG: response regulator, partial [Myxococcales bacterium]